MIKSFKHLSLYEKEWTSILHTNGNTNPFLEFHFIYNWWRYLSDRKNIEIYSVRENKQVIGFFPFEVIKKQKVTIVQTLAIQGCPYLDFVVKNRDLDRVLMFVMDGIILNKQRAVFHIHSLRNNGLTQMKLTNYMKARSFKYRLITNAPAHTPKIIPAKMHDKLCLLGNLEVKIGTLNELFDNLEGTIDNFNISSNDRLDFTKKFEGDMPKVDVKSIYFENELLAFSFGFQCRGEYMEYGNGILKELTEASTLLQEETTMDSPATTYLLFSTKNLMGTFALLLRKRHINKKENRILINSPSKKQRRNKQSVVIAELKNIHIKSPDSHFTRISNEEIWSVNRPQTLLYYLHGFEGYHSGDPLKSFWVNRTSLYIAKFKHKEKLDGETIFIDGWENEELEKILCFVQSTYKERNILVQVKKDNKNQLKKLLLFGFEVRDKHTLESIS